MGKRQGNPAIAGIGHVVVGDLEGARRTWETLGFTLTPRCRHKGWGTANYCVMFADDYIELFGIVDARRFTNNLDQFLDEHGEGLLSLALATDDAKVAYRGLRRVGAEAPKTLGRLLELPEGTVDARFSLVHLPPAATPGLRAFVYQHLTPESGAPPALADPCQRRSGARGHDGRHQKSRVGRPGLREALGRRSRGAP